MQCDASLNTLVTKNVHTSKPISMVPNVRDGFQLEQPNIVTSCQDAIFNATEMFCLLPDNAVLDAGMCALSLQTNVAQGFYERLVRGEIQHPDEMVAIWEGSNVASDEPWIDAPTANPMHVDLPNGDYVGFKGVSNDRLQDLAVSNNAAVILFVEGGQAFQGDSDGLLRPIPELKGFDGDSQSVACNGSGKIRAAIFPDQAWIFVNNAWQKTQNDVPIDVQYQNVKIWETSTSVFVGVLFSSATLWGLDIFQFKDNVSNPPSSLVPVFRGGQLAPQQNEFRAGWIMLSPDNGLLICSTFNQFTSSDTMNMHLFDINNFATPPQYDKWSITDHIIAVFLESNPPPIRGEAVCTGIFDNPYLQCATILGQRLRIQFQLTSTTVDGVLIVFETFQPKIRIRDNIFHTQRLSLLDETIFIDAMWTDALTISNQAASFALDDLTSPYIFTISPDASDVWIFRNGKLFRLHTAVPPMYGTAWTHTFNMYHSDQTKVSDYGVPALDKDVWMPGTRWFLGTNTLDTSIPLQRTFPVEVARSPHQNFRYQMHAPVQDTNPVSFLYAVCTLQRANEYVLAQHAQVILRNDGNFIMQVSPKDPSVIWQPRLQDIDSPSPELFNLLNLAEAPFAVASPNGQYILYVSLKNGPKLRLVDNAFNSARFSAWCQQQPSRFDRALQIQSNFCWNSLKITKPANSLDFADPRCICVGGTRLFELMFPNAEQVPQGLLAPVEENIPCVANGCSSSFQDDTINTNAKQYFKDRCSGRVFNVCQAALDIGSDTTFINVNYINPINCTTNQFFNCDNDSQCGPGLTCFNGNCVSKCQTTIQCQQFAGNTFTACVQGRCQQMLHTQPKSIWTPLFISVLIAGIVFVAMMLLLLGLLGRRAGLKT